MGVSSTEGTTDLSKLAEDMIRFGFACVEERCSLDILDLGW